jgi:hypothetical protein
MVYTVIYTTRPQNLQEADQRTVTEIAAEQYKHYHSVRCLGGEYHTIEDGPESILLWCRFPDQRYTDSTAVDEGLFDGIWDGFELAWRNTVQALPPDRKVLVTSDHGYVFLKSGFSDTRLKSADRPLNGKRFRFFSPEEALPENVPGLRVDEPRRLAILAGRAHNRPQGPSASQSVYRHGGLSIMEMLTPWLVLGPVGSI